MNEAHLHLLFNHLPIVTPIIGLLILILGFLLRSEIIKRTAYFVFIFGALSTIPAFASGEGAEEVVEGLQGIQERMIHTHEEAAELFALLSYFLGGIALIGLWASWKKKSFANLISILVLLLGFVTVYYAQQTGTSGGEIRHSEIRQAGKLSPSMHSEHEEDQD